jgi:hypothetical protein
MSRIKGRNRNKKMSIASEHAVPAAGNAGAAHPGGCMPDDFLMRKN